MMRKVVSVQLFRYRCREDAELHLAPETDGMVQRGTAARLIAQ